MGYIVRMPQMGMEMDQGEIVAWEFEEGEPVEEDEVIAVVESEKAANDVEAREDGTIRRILVEEGGRVEPGTPIGIFAKPDEDLSQFESEVDVSLDAASADDSADEPTPVAATQSASGGTADLAETSEDVRASPGARRLASEESVDLTAVNGSGPGGAISEDDVQAYLDQRETKAAAGSAESVRASPGARKLANQEGMNLAAVDGSGPGGAITEDDVEEHLESGGVGGVAGAATRTVGERRELSGIQRTISERLGKSYREAVHVTLNRAFDTESLRQVANAAKAQGVDGSINDLLLAAIGEQLEARPEFNALFEDDEHKLIEEVNVGVAVDADAGLLTPVVPSVTEKSVEEIAGVRHELTERALSGEFTGDDLSGGTFTVTNLGTFGIDDFDPVINPPEVAILGVGRIRDDGTMTLSLSFDHRVVNGADGARFLDGLVDTLTDPAALAGFFDADVSTEPVGADLDEREIRIETESGLSGQYTTPYGTVAFDEPESVGGSGSAPSPVDHFLGALGSCLSLMVRQMATRSDVEVGAIACDVDGTPDEGPLESIDVALRIETDADEETLDSVVQRAERACYVARTIGDDVAMTLDVERRS